MDQSVVNGGAMNELLKYLMSQLSFLHSELNARFVDSISSGSNAMILMETADLRLRLVCDRAQVFLDFQSRHRPSDDDWFSFDVVQQLITGKIIDSAEMDDEKVNFLRNHFTDISDHFSASRREETENILHRYEELRAKRLFG